MAVESTGLHTPLRTLLNTVSTRSLIVGLDHHRCQTGAQAVGTSVDWRGPSAQRHTSNRPVGRWLSLPKLPHAWPWVAACSLYMVSLDGRGSLPGRRQKVWCHHVPGYSASDGVPLSQGQVTARSQVPCRQPAGHIQRRNVGRRGGRLRLLRAWEHRGRVRPLFNQA